MLLSLMCFNLRERKLVKESVKCFSFFVLSPSSNEVCQNWFIGFVLMAAGINTIRFFPA